MKQNDTQYHLLLNKSRECFIRYGLHGTTIDEIAREMSVSKKTFYRYVDSKSTLVKILLNNYLTDKNTQLKSITGVLDNPVEARIKLTSLFFAVICEARPHVTELRMHYPDHWSTFNNFLMVSCKEAFVKNILDGIEKGLYRSNLNADVIANVYLAGLEILLRQEIFPEKKYNVKDLYREFLNYHHRAILTPKGLMVLERSKLNDQRENGMNTWGSAA